MRPEFHFFNLYSGTVHTYKRGDRLYQRPKFQRLHRPVSFPIYDSVQLDPQTRSWILTKEGQVLTISIKESLWQDVLLYRVKNTLRL